MPAVVRGDQLDAGSAVLDDFDPGQDAIRMAEADGEFAKHAEG